MRLAFLTTFALATTTLAATAPVPKVSGSVAITQANPIWMASQLPLSRWGYIEEEYFMEGTANIYAAMTAPPLQVASTVPYRTRILVRRPSDARRFSGNVILEPIHPGRSTPSLATDFRWLYAAGDIWVGVEPPGNFAILQKFNPTRYASLMGGDKLTVHDLLTQASALLQSPSDPIPGLRVKDVFMQGVSATCQIVSQYIISLHRDTTLAGGKPVVSGYFPSLCATLLPDINVPVMRINTEYDYKADARKPDSDKNEGRYRLYELAGAAHFSTNNVVFGEPLHINHGAGMPPATGDQMTCKEFGPPRYAALNDFPVWIAFDAALRNLEDWVQKGKTPPHAELFAVDAAGKPVLDERGNFKGGLRTPVVDSPTAAWYPQGTDCFLWGYKIPFTKEVLTKLYPTHAAYVSQVKLQADKAVKDGFITPEDAKFIIVAAEHSSVPETEDAATEPMQAWYPFATP